MFAITTYAQSGVNVTTYHNDNVRSGQNLHETMLTPALVQMNTFGKLFSQPVDGQIYAQPLVLANLLIPHKGVHTVVYVATENDSVFAFDGNSNTGSNASPLWQVSFINPALGITTVPSSDLGTDAIYPQVGITGTPVIDPNNGTLYAVAATKENGTYVQRLHALDVTTGAEKFGGPVVIAATVKGTGSGSAGGNLSFDPFRSNQRPGLLLLNGGIYIAWASHGLESEFTYHGWVIGYNETTLAQISAYCVTANGDQGGVWQSGDGLAADKIGNLYFMSGNGTFDANTGGQDYGMSYVKLSTKGGLKVADYFTPYNEAEESSEDLDLGSGGAMLLPYQNGAAHPNLAVGAGKDGVLYVVDQTDMGHFNASGNQQIVESIPNAFAGHGLYSTPAYWQGYLYFWCPNDVLRVFQMVHGLVATSPVATGSTVFGSPGATVEVSANEASNGIVWAIQPNGYSTGAPAVLYALNPTTAAELYNSTQAGTRDTAGPAIKFTPPTVANGKVYVPTASELDVYGLLTAGSGK
ncbi:MAG: hypothetical protein WCA49_21195 [Candidatus Sulfotelmatobacter sp.]